MRQRAGSGRPGLIPGRRRGGAVPGRGAAGDAELAVDVLEVLGDRPGADLQRVRYGAVRAALDGEFEDLLFAAGQVGLLTVGG